VALNNRQLRFVARLPTACKGSKSKELFEYSAHGAPVGIVAVTEHARGRRAEMTRCPEPGEKPAGKAIILEDDTEAKRAAELLAKEKECKSGSAT
jgi:hypothetical protein